MSQKQQLAQKLYMNRNFSRKLSVQRESFLMRLAFSHRSDFSFTYSIKEILNRNINSKL